VVICDARGRPVEGATVRIEAFHNARAGEARTLEAREAGAGRYETALALDRAGIWIFRIEAVRGEARFLAEERREVGP
jgi:nitrogen fixation protein FixH